jgi:hypothetical protein
LQDLRKNDADYNSYELIAFVGGKIKEDEGFSGVWIVSGEEMVKKGLSG